MSAPDVGDDGIAVKCDSARNATGWTWETVYPGLLEFYDPCSDCFDEPPERGDRVLRALNAKNGKKIHLPETSTDGGQETITACPECDTAHVVLRTGRSSQTTKADSDYRCRHGHEFDDPIERPPHNESGSSRCGLSRVLEQADPDDVATDGGWTVVCGSCGARIASGMATNCPDCGERDALAVESVAPYREAGVEWRGPR